MDRAVIADLVAYSAQIACLALVGGLLPSLLRVDAAGVRYAYFRAVLALCLVLPWLQGRQEAGEAVVTTTLSSAVVGGPAASGAQVAAAAPFPWLTALGIVLAGGVAARAIWIAIGLIRLRRLRGAGHQAPACEEHQELQRLIGTCADIRYVAGLGQPVTFGVRRPLVLLPDSLRAQPVLVQRAVLSHELIHVRRRDWAWLLAEEAVRAVFWFHPGVWWLVSRVQLAREEVVDQMAMLATGTRRAYLEALAAFADETPLVPAAAFARRRHLFRRMRLISREGSMSSRRVVLSSAAMALVVIAGGWYAVGAFPLREAPEAQEALTQVGPLERQAKAITPENPVPRRIISVDPVYPPEAAIADVNATVTLMIMIDGSGRVGEVRRVGVSPTGLPGTAIDQQAMRTALDALVRAGTDAVRQWQYEVPAEAPIAVRVTFAFGPNFAPRQIAHDAWSVVTVAGGVGAARGRQGGPVQLGAAPPPPPPPPLPPSQNLTASPEWAVGAIRVGGAIKPPAKMKHVNPVYPPIAMSSRVQGVVILEVVIGADGRVAQARVLRSIPLLDQAAIDAVMQWEFTPTLLNGQPVPIIMTTTVQFTLT
ncbi:MAG TPA: TonB family protein [Vicinamibacterales bacterium]|nr:TonB family protein [Vicinamibacterales bacterium]